MKRDKPHKVNLKTIIAVILIASIFIIPFRKSTFLDGGSNIYEPLVPWYGLINYHHLVVSEGHHDLNGEFIPSSPESERVSYIGGHGMILFWFIEIVFDKYEVYTDGHQEKISGFGVYFGGSDESY